MTWQEELVNNIRTARELCEALDLPESRRVSLSNIIKRYPMSVSRYYLSLIDRSDPDDPIARMCIPSESEILSDGAFDTSGEGQNTVGNGVQHKYEQTALILSTNICAMYCRHCFRKRLVGLSDDELNQRAEDAAEYVRNHPEINNVLISGGDALMNPNSVLERYLSEMADIPTVKIIRIGSRTPVSFPQRITTDPELAEILRKYAEKKALCLVTQFNHPRELTEEALSAVKIIRDCGVQVRNQTVLLRGVNDRPEVLGELLRKLTAASVIPYYIFQCRPVKGVKEYFQIPLREGIRIVDGARSMQNGIGKSVRFAMSHPIGKIEILGTNPGNGKILFKVHQSRKPEYLNRIFELDLSDRDAWIESDMDLSAG